MIKTIRNTNVLCVFYWVKLLDKDHLLRHVELLKLKGNLEPVTLWGMW